MMNFGKSRAKMANDSTVRVTFKNVAGLDEEKEELKASGFKSIPTETGELFVPERGISVSENIKLGLVKFLWGTRITIKGVAVQ